MQKVKEFFREDKRLIELESYSIMDSPREDEYDNLTAIAAGICGTPISLISLIDDKRQWFKSHHGLGVPETSKDSGFCAHAIHDHNEIFIVKDARLDDRFEYSDLVTDDNNVIFYAGVTLVSERGLPLGTLCVIDDKPRELSGNQKKLLAALADQVMIILNLRKAKLTIASNERAALKKRDDNEWQLNKAQKIAKIGSWLFQPSNQESFWSEEMFTIWGFDPKNDTPVYTDIIKRIKNEDLELYNSALENALSIGTPTDIIIHIHHPNGHTKTIRTISKSVFNDIGEVISLCGTNQDITEMDLLRTESESVAKELRQFIETANAPIFGIDSKGMVNEWNQTSEKITGFKKEEVLGKDLVATFITSDYQKQVKEVLDNALKGEETANYEFPLFTKDDKRVMVLLNSSTRRNSDGEIVGVLGVGQDITILNDYKENLENKVKERTYDLEKSLKREQELGLIKTNFVSMASHQFRTPLSVIQANSELYQMILMQDKSITKIGSDKITNRIIDQVKVMTSLMDRVLSLGSISSGTIPSSRKKENIVDLCSSLVEQFNLTQTDGRSLDFNVQGSPYFSLIDGKMFVNALSNLISNAFKYSIGRPNPQLIISYRVNDIKVTVKDFGVGVPKEEANSLIQPFFRASNALNVKGTGLGLSIVKECLDICKAELIVNTKLGEGSSLDIKIKKVI